MKTLIKQAWSNKKTVFTVVVAFLLYLFANSTGYGFIHTITHLAVNGFVFFVAAKALLRTAGSKKFFKGKKMRIVFEEPEKQEETV